MQLSISHCPSESVTTWTAVTVSYIHKHATCGRQWTRAIHAQCQATCAWVFHATPAYRPTIAGNNWLVGEWTSAVQMRQMERLKKIKIRKTLNMSVVVCSLLPFRLLHLRRRVNIATVAQWLTDLMLSLGVSVCVFAVPMDDGVVHHVPLPHTQKWRVIGACRMWMYVVRLSHHIFTFLSLSLSLASAQQPEITVAMNIQYTSTKCE